GYATLEHSIEAMKKGAFDFIPKPFTPDQLRVVTSKAIKHTRALRDIADARSRLRVMVNQLSDGVMTTDSQKRVVLANPAFLRMIGHPGERVIGRGVEEFITHESLLGFIDQALATPPDHFKEITGELNTGEDGEIVLGASSAPFRDRSGLNIGAITVLRDITALKKMDRMKSDFVSMVSHEIRGPMNSLQMQIKVILDGLAGEVTEKQRQILERASGKIDNLVNMASELLDLARIESGLITREKEELDMSELLADQADFHQPRALEEGIRIHLEPLPPLPLILANPGNMEEILSNLITNAVKYSPRG
ncbi:MAG: PAS domain-containing protein, partial [Desulfobacterales bacterium]|nr:PAS domain-containing protein [Desulfobacterales bacterium]